MRRRQKESKFLHKSTHNVCAWPQRKMPTILFSFECLLRNECLLDLMRFVYFNCKISLYFLATLSLYIIIVFRIYSRRSNNIFFSFDKATNHNFGPSSIYLQSWLHQMQKLDLYEFSLLLAFSFSYSITYLLCLLVLLCVNETKIRDALNMQSESNCARSHILF